MNCPLVRIVAVALALAYALTGAPPAQAGTTGGITGRVLTAGTNEPIAGATINAVSPSQTASATTDASGGFRFLSLSPDSYTISVQHAGYNPVAQAGIAVFADQVQTINITMQPALKQIGTVTSRAAGLVKAGSTSDVYSVNPTVAGAASGLIGPGGLTNAYGAIASVPGVQIDAGEQGWFQTVKIRGGDIDQVGYE
ncbi:MAG: carboxypeptidase regulatory-like domain-containing protein, partial [Candidatus Eremiobacteraeota bacterium]|nr:carboxypeptidase regulatory-like domain-containing protein [Candidatus Eremiobacteraeota bacterium]